MNTFDEIAAKANVALEQLEDFLHTPAGRRLRQILGAGLILAAPLVMRPLRRHPIGRAIELAGGTALLIRLAEAVRDWEREHEAPRVIDVPPNPAA